MANAFVKLANKIGSAKIMGYTVCILLIMWMMVTGVMYLIPGAPKFWPFTSTKFYSENFEAMTQDDEMMGVMQGNHNTVIAGEEDLMLHNEEMKKLSEMEEMNALGCPGMNGLVPYAPVKTEGYAYTGPEMGPNALSNIKPGYMNGKSAGILNNTGLPGSEVKSSVGAEVTGFIGDNRQFPQFPQDQLDAEELLPKERSDQFAQLFPEGQGHLSNRRDFLTSGYHIGINTVGQTRRNSNYGLRGELPNPQTVVSVFNNSTITPDINRRPFEIGEC